jgi:3-phosphoshikimate 1-carboxyvinyltransferase
MNLPGDKSLAHRALILAAIANGISVIENFPLCRTCLTTLSCMRQLNVNIDILDKEMFSHMSTATVIIYGKGIYGLRKSNKVLDASTSGTTLRLLIGLLSAQNFSSAIKLIKNRPIMRVIVPIRQMNANINISKNTIRIINSELFGINFNMPVASAQLKSSIILASLYANNSTTIIEKIKTRDHTENLVNYFGGNIITNSDKIICQPTKNLTAQKIKLPGDVSSAAFFIALTIINQSKLLLKNILINPRRIGFIRSLKKMGADIIIENKQSIYSGETAADIKVSSNKLYAIEIDKSDTVDMIDEVLIFIITALFADGISVVKDIEELKVKESNRIKSICSELDKLNINIQYDNNKVVIHGRNMFSLSKNINTNVILDSHNDHRVAMSLSIILKVLKLNIKIKNTQCVADSFPDFFTILDSL